MSQQDHEPNVAVDGNSLQLDIMHSLTEPILLLTTYTLAPGRSTEEKPLTAQPHKHLDPKFASGWNKLSDELKVHILAYIVISDEPIDRENKWGSTLGGNKDLISYCSMAPDIAGLAREIFYSHNTFHIGAQRYVHDENNGHLVRRCLDLPHPSARPLIRTLKVSVHIAGSELKDLQNIAHGISGFSALQYVKVIVDIRSWNGMKFCNNDFTRARNLISSFFRGGIFFDCEGELEIIEAERWPELDSDVVKTVKRNVVFNCAKV
ncbi:hypothetical protein CC80DRAFT_502965 [Byssothecium circinans]|uniref:Uncharacterized protein n=1 Tax=Byssothecium circinans TaxID=147558 RepID=A0A6A5TZ65_9PLEO|nr:hypothetical protein CC80DRAFT_502965 [Byssothecium circinans]